MKNIFTFLLISWLVLNISCSNDDNSRETVSLCDFFAMVDETHYQNTATSNYMLTNITLNGDCLEITLGSSGCNADNWEMKLIASENYSDEPTVRPVKVELINNEACLAAFTKTNSFDLKPLQVSGRNEILLHIEGWEYDVHYQY